MPLPNTLTGKWRCVCPKLHHGEIDFDMEERLGNMTFPQCPTCDGRYSILVRAEQSGSFDQREDEEID